MVQIISKTHNDFDPQKRKKFEVKMRLHSGMIEKAIFIDNEMLDWTLDISSYLECRKMGTEYKHAAQQDIEKHFIDSVSDFLNRKVTIDEIKAAIKIGWI